MITDSWLHNFFYLIKKLKEHPLFLCFNLFVLTLHSFLFKKSKIFNKIQIFQNK